MNASDAYLIEEIDQIDARLLELRAEELSLERKRQEVVAKLYARPLAYTQQQAAKALNRSVTTVWRMTRDGRLALVDELIPVWSIDEYLRPKKTKRNERGRSCAKPYPLSGHTSMKPKGHIKAVNHSWI